jgi:MoaA/NifB/PqqE/SkfB family radical SAM enzyme
MRLTGLHLLLTYECNFECDHCFVWSSPRQQGTLTITQIDDILRQAGDLGTIDWIYFEGGEPFLYHAILRHGIRRASSLGFKVGLVSNGYWATTGEDAIEWLRDLAGSLDDLSVSCDLYHGDADQRRHAEHALQAARTLGIPAGTIAITQPESMDSASAVGQIPEGESKVMYRGRAAATLAARVPLEPWTRFDECPYENLREPGRVHVDPLGNVHICQGISLGNLFRMPLREICDAYVPDEHPVTGPLLAGGPAELARRYQVSRAAGYADACHLCDHVRRALRSRFPEILTPDQMYGPVAATPIR